MASVSPNSMLINMRHLHFESYRLQTFRDWSIQAPIRAERLAKAGFYYLGNNSEVVCGFCYGRISDWEFGDLAMEKHICRFPNCVFVKNQSNNIPILHERVPSIYREGVVPDWGTMRPFPSPETLYRMKYESERIKTFRGNWNLDYISPSELAKTGFFYLHPPDKVQCAFCRGVLSDWLPGDQPYTEHINHFGSCPFLRGRDVGNVSLGDVCRKQMRMINSFPDHTSKIQELGVNIHQEGPKHRSQIWKETRLKSFLSWPQNGAVKTEDLADAGFFYTGISNNVTCFYCGGSLSHWEAGDNPWVEHARWFPKCVFVRLNKGGEFVQFSLARQEPIQPPFPLPKPSYVDQTVDTVMNSNMVQSFLKTQSSYPPYLVRLAILQHLQWTGIVVSNVDGLCDAIHKVKDEKPRVPREEEAPTDDKMAEKKLCKICMTEEVKVVFLPCGHFIACVDCASALKNCALCRKPIKGSIRAFLS